jgi:leukotriene-A4 hydrolase
MGNLVSCKNWQHFWLNEGWTVFVERKIEQAVNGEQAQHLMAILGSFALKDSIKQMGVDHQFTQLVPGKSTVGVSFAYF